MKAYIVFGAAALFISTTVVLPSLEDSRGIKSTTFSVTKDADKDKKSAPDVLHYYHSLPVEYIGSVQAYYDRKKAENPKYAPLDDAKQRDQFIKRKDVAKGFLQVQVPGDEHVTRMQLFPVKDQQAVLAVEESLCKPHCTENSLRIFSYTAEGEWKEITTEAIPAVDYEKARKKLKSAYKKQYLDNDVYERQGYDNDDKLQSKLVYNIEPGKIVLREIELPLDLYELRFNKGKQVFMGK